LSLKANGAIRVFIGPMKFVLVRMAFNSHTIRLADG
jgi:hypothetical protein